MMAKSLGGRGRSVGLLCAMAGSVAITLAGCNHENPPTEFATAEGSAQASSSGGGRGEPGTPLFPEPAEQKAITAIEEAGHSADAVGYGPMRFVQTTGRGAAGLKGVTGLETVNLALKDVTDDDLASVEDLPTVHGLLVFSSRVTDQGLVHLKPLTGLKYLWIEQANLNGDALENLKGLTDLESLNLRFKPLTGGLKHLEGLTKLKSLNIPGTKITDADLESLKPMTQLESLNIGGSPITDDGLVNLKGLKNLKNIQLRQTDITDAGLEHLKELKNLEQVNLLLCKGVTAEGVESLQAALPDCEIRS